MVQNYIWDIELSIYAVLLKDLQYLTDLDVYLASLHGIIQSKIHF